MLGMEPRASNLHYKCSAAKCPAVHLVFVLWCWQLSPESHTSKASALYWVYQPYSTLVLMYSLPTPFFQENPKKCENWVGNKKWKGGGVEWVLEEWCMHKNKKATQNWLDLFIVCVPDVLSSHQSLLRRSVESILCFSLSVRRFTHSTSPALHVAF